MRTKLILPLLAGCVLAACSTASAQTFQGNGGAGFGGTVGNGMLSVASVGNNLNFTFTAGAGFDNDLVIYLDTVAGSGFSDTTTFTDNQDGGREAISGFNNANPSRTPAFFSSGFGADFAISLESPTSGNYAGLFSLTDATATTSNFHYIDGMAPVVNGNVYSFTLTRTDLGIAANAAFTLEATYISTTAYRSNETIGASTTTLDPTNTGTAPNAGFTGSVTFTGSDTVLGVPEPGSLACLGFGAVAVAGLAKRRARRASMV